MAGGIHAQFVACPICLFDEGKLTKAERVYEGDESDAYACEEGHRSEIDWSDGEAKDPQWPPSPELKKTAAEYAQAGGAA